MSIKNGVVVFFEQRNKVMPSGTFHLKELDSDKITLDGTLSVSGASTFKGDAALSSNLSVAGDTALANTTAGNVGVDGTLSVSGQITMGGHIIPDTNDTYDIGSPEYKIRDLYVSNNSIWVGDTTKLSFTNGRLKFRKRKTNVVPAAILQAGRDADHANDQATLDSALAHAGVSSVHDMKLFHWQRYMRDVFNVAAEITDIFRDNDEDYEETSASDAWKEINDTKIYTNTHVGIGTSDPAEALHIRGAIKVEDGFSLAKNEGNNPSVKIDTQNFGVDDTVNDMTGMGSTKFTKLYRVYGTNSDGVGQNWYWGYANDDYTHLSLASDGSGSPDPDISFVFTTSSELYCNKVYAALSGNADTASRLETPRTINGVAFDGSADITVGVDGIATLNGNVGIGTSTPSSQLELYGEGKDLTFKYDAGIVRQSTANRDEYFSGLENSIKRVGDRNVFDGSPYTPDTTHEILFGFSDLYNQWSGLDEYYPRYMQMRLRLWSPSSSTEGDLIDVMNLRGDGNVGIGSSDPSVRLHIKGTSPRTLSTANGPSFSDYGQLVITDATAPSGTSTLGNLKIGFDASTGTFGTGFIQCVNPNVYTGPFVIQPYGGNVGIQTTSPQYTLDVNGTLGQRGKEIYAQRRWEIDLTSLPNTSFYPIEFTHPASEGNPDLPDYHPVSFKVFGESLSASDPYNENTLLGYARGSGWTDHEPFYDVHVKRYTGYETRFQGLYEGTQSYSRAIVIYMRGGYRYSTLTDASEVVTHTSPYTVETSTFAIKDSSGADVSGTSANISQLVNIAGSSGKDERWMSGHLNVPSVDVGVRKPFNFRYSPSPWGFVKGAGNEEHNMYSFDITAPCHGWIHVKTNGHWAVTSDGVNAYLGTNSSFYAWISVNNQYSGATELVDDFQGVFNSSVDRFHEYNPADAVGAGTWRDLNFNAWYKVNAGTNTISLRVRNHFSNSGYLHINGSSINGMFIPQIG